MIETRRDASHFLRLVFESSPYFDTGALDTPQIAWQIVVGSLRRLDALGRPQTPGTYGLALGTAVGAIGGSVPRRAHPCAFVLTERVAWTLPLQRAPAALRRGRCGSWAAGAGARAQSGRRGLAPQERSARPRAQRNFIVVEIWRQAADDIALRLGALFAGPGHVDTRQRAGVHGEKRGDAFED